MPNVDIKTNIDTIGNVVVFAVPNELSLETICLTATHARVDAFNAKEPAKLNSYMAKRTKHLNGKRGATYTNDVIILSIMRLKITVVEASKSVNDGLSTSTFLLT